MAGGTVSAKGVLQLDSLMEPNHPTVSGMDVAKTNRRAFSGLRILNS